MHALAPRRLALPALLLAAAAGCGSSGMGALSVHLQDAQGPYDEIWLHVMSVEVQDPSGGWMTLATPDRRIDLLKLTGGVIDTLADGKTLAPGHYNQIRLVLGSDNEVNVPGIGLQPLTVPSGLQTGLKIVCRLDVKAGETTDAFVDIDGAHSILLHDTGVPTYILRPVVRCGSGSGGGGTGTPTGGSATGSISGTVAWSDGESSGPLSGVRVTAQTVDGAGVGTVVQSADADAGGNYTLGSLPVGATYYVVSQPVVTVTAGTPPVTTSTAYFAKAGPPIALTAGMPTATYNDPDFAPAGIPGEIDGTVSPMASAMQVDRIDARQSLPVGSSNYAFVVRTEDPVVGASETYSMLNVPSGTYSLSVFRVTSDGSGGSTATTGVAMTAVVVGGGNTTANLGF